jgi:pseudaminic acid synthase
MIITSDKGDFIVKGAIWENQNLHKFYQKVHTTWEWQKQLMQISKEEDMVCFSSPFDDTSVVFLETLNVPAYKIASFETTNIPLIELVVSKGRPVIIFTEIAE